MKNANPSQKNANSKIAKKDENLKEINLSKFSKELSGIELKEKREKESLYIYPENFDKNLINSNEGKKFRNKRRNEMQRIMNNILIFAKYDRKDDLKKEIESFDKIYKEFYSKNDYSFHSISNSEKNKSLYDLSLEIIKECKSK